MSLITRSLRRATLFLVLCLATTVRGQVANSSPHPIPRAAPPSAGENLLITVVDENDIPVPSALIFLQSSPGVLQLKCETDFVGHCSFQGLVADSYQLSSRRKVSTLFLQWQCRWAKPSQLTSSSPIFRKSVKQ